MVPQARSLFSGPWSTGQHRNEAWAFLLNGRTMIHDEYKKVIAKRPIIFVQNPLTMFHVTVSRRPNPHGRT